MPKKGGPGSRKSVRVEEKAALEAEQAAAVVDAQTAAKEAQAAADAAAEELAVYRAETASAAEAAAQKAAAELSELKEQLEQAKRAGSPVRAGGRANPFEETPAPAPEGEEASGTPLVCVLIHGGSIALKSLLTDCNAIVSAWYPGQQGGGAFADLAFGKVSPSGRSTDGGVFWASPYHGRWHMLSANLPRTHLETACSLADSAVL